MPSCTVVELALAIDRLHADCVISFGGGSPIDTVKAAIHTLLTAGGGGASTDEGPVHISIPTTLSAGEFTAVVGITDERTRVKRAVSDPRLVPRTVYTDPTVTLETPAWLWAASGVRALDHAVETIYSARRHPFSDAVAARGLSMLLTHLPASLSTTGPEQLEHRLQCQMGAWLCGLRGDQCRPGSFACARASDRAAMERRARGDVVHHAAACDAVHGDTGAGSFRVDRAGLRRVVRFGERDCHVRSSVATGWRASSRSSISRSDFATCRCRRTKSVRSPGSSTTS